MKKILFVILVGSLLGCSSSTPESDMPLPDISASQDIVNLVTSNWSEMLTQCPGLNKYQDDITVNSINDMLGLDDGRVDVEFLIADNTKKIPNNYRVNGHHCYFGISADGTELSISKRACVSVCLDKDMFNPANESLMKTGHNYVAKLKN